MASIFCIVPVCSTFWLRCLVRYTNFVKPARTYYRLNAASSSSGRAGVYDHRSESLIGQLSEHGGQADANSPAELALSKKELGAAGLRSDAAPSIMIGTKLILCAVLLVSGVGLRDRMTERRLLRLLFPSAERSSGTCFQGWCSDRLAARRREAIRLALPDALDMLVVCSEVGCALDQAIQYVSRDSNPCTRP